MNENIRNIFREVSHRYEAVNHILTLGLDIIWRRNLVRSAVAGGGTRWLDVCCGTGETAVALSRLSGKDTKVFAVDFCESMIHKVTKKKDAHKIRFTLADAVNLPFKDNSFDLVTISFAARNINISHNTLNSCLREFYRILKYGGRFTNLETTQPKHKLINTLFRLYVRIFVKPIGYLVSGSKAGYAYLSHTIPRFYGADDFRNIIKKAGFSKVDYKILPFGLVAIHKAVK